MTTQHIETLIIGAGQAGLATGYHLQRLGRPFLIVDGNERIGDNWRCHYDSLRLYSPVKYDGLPGMAFEGDPWHFPGKDEVAAFLEAYAVRFNLPVRLQTRVDRLSARPGGGFIARLGDETLTCDNAVLATGTFGRTPRAPELAARLDPGIRQLHSSEYKNPRQLQPGTTLVVGASHSGYDIAYEVGADRPTVLVGPDRGNIPFEWETRKMRLAMPIVVFAWKHLLTRRTPMGRKEMQKVRHEGGPTTRVKPHHLDERGVRRYQEKVTDVSPAGRPVLADGRELDVANIVWATGFQRELGWIDAPLRIEDGWPVERRGVVDSAPGLFFCGLSFQYAFSSMVLPGVGRDAAYVARRIAARQKGSGRPTGRPARVAA